MWRGDDTDGELEDFTVEVNEGEVVLDIIHRLQATDAPDLAVRWNCKAGKCGSCSAEINGRPRLLCMTRMSTFEESEVITVTPLRAFPVIKDLVTDVSFNYAKAREVPSFRPPAELGLGEYRMAQVDVERSQEFRKCIECFLCQDTCHVIRDHEDNKDAFAGPRFFIRLAELDMHPLDTMDRKREAQEQHGLGMCNITKCCTEVCPEHIKITDNAIIPMKERVVDTMYDPVIWLGNKIPRRSAVAANRALDAGDAATAEGHARTRLRQKPSDRTALRALEDSLIAQGRFAEAADVTRQRLAHAGRGASARQSALNDHVWALLCAVEAGQLELDRTEDEISSTLQQAQRMASTGTVLAGTHALHHLVHGRLAEAVEHARDSLRWLRSRQARADDLITLARGACRSRRARRVGVGDGRGAVPLAGQPAAGRGAREPAGHGRRLAAPAPAPAAPGHAPPAGRQRATPRRTTVPARASAARSGPRAAAGCPRPPRRSTPGGSRSCPSASRRPPGRAAGSGRRAPRGTRAPAPARRSRRGRPCRRAAPSRRPAPAARRRRAASSRSPSRMAAPTTHTVTTSHSGRLAGWLSCWTRKEIEDALAALPGWDYDGTKLVRRVPVAADAQDNLESAVMKVADELDHHPVIERGEGELRFDVWSHSAGGVTAKDLELAARIDQTLSGPVQD